MVKKADKVERQGRVVALTGAFGFIGVNLMRLLDADESCKKIVAIDIRQPPLHLEKMSYYKLDLTAPTADTDLIRIFKEESVDCVVHLSFIGNPVHNSQWVHELEVIGTLKVLDACAITKVKKLISWSITMVYGARPSNPNFLREDHPKNGAYGVQFVNDKLEVEKEVLYFGTKHPDIVVTILRTCTILGPTVTNVITNMMARRVVLVPMGFDPLMQFVHEVDVTDAFKMALDMDLPGDYNIVGDGVLNLSTILKIAGKFPLPVPYTLGKQLYGTLWSAQFTRIPPGFIDYFRYVWVADGTKAREKMGFIPKYSSKEALLNFVGTQRLRHVNLID